MTRLGDYSRPVHPSRHISVGAMWTDQEEFVDRKESWLERNELRLTERGEFVIAVLQAAAIMAAGFVCIWGLWALGTAGIH